MTPPTPPLGMSDFFALEAGEYLERLDALLQKPDLAADEFVRLARALRGSALMANQPAIARVAGGVEALARAARERQGAWSAAERQLAIRAVDDLKVFVRRAGSWAEPDTVKATTLATELERQAGTGSARPAATARAPETPALDAGARAFVAREGAAIASALDRAAQALRTNPPARDPLQQVLRTLQQLRGLAALNALPPLPDLLEGIERAIGVLERGGAGQFARASELFQAAATAIARAAREVADQGRPNPESAEFTAFAALAVRLIDSESDVVPVASLYYDDQGPHVVRRGTAATPPTTVGHLELVSHGEHLRQAADSLERAPTPTQRELRAHTLAGTFRALADLGGSALAERVARFARAARDVALSGATVRSPQAFAALLRRGGDVLAQSGGESPNEQASVAALDRLVSEMQALLPASEPAEAGPTPGSPDLAGSWMTYQQLVGAGVEPASLEHLLRPSSVDTARPRPAPQPARSGEPRSVEPGVVDVRTLLYRGDRALARAQELRAQARHASGDALRSLIEEVCDLVALALEPSPPASP